MSSIAHIDSNKAPVLSMQDDLGIVYLIESAQQFWAGEYCGSILELAATDSIAQNLRTF